MEFVPYSLSVDSHLEGLLLVGGQPLRHVLNEAKLVQPHEQISFKCEVPVQEGYLRPRIVPSSCCHALIASISKLDLEQVWWVSFTFTLFNDRRSRQDLVFRTIERISLALR